MRVFKVVGRLSISLLIFVVALEIGLNLIAPIYRTFHSYHYKESNRKILILGESTSTEIATGHRRSWPIQLQEMLASKNLKFNVINFSKPGITTTGLIKNLSDYLMTETPALVISMMGINDSPHFWYREMNLIKDQNDGFQLKSLKLLKILLNYKKIVRSEEEAKEHQEYSRSRLDYPRVGKLISNLNQAPFGSKRYKKLLIGIEAFLSSKSKTEKAQFYAFLASLVNKPEVSGPPIAFEKAYSFYKLAVQNDAEVFKTLERSLYFAKMSGHSADCKELVETAINQKANLTEVAYGRLVSCIPEDPDYIESVLLKMNAPFYFDKRTDSPTLSNYQKIFKLLMDKNICWIAMSYPRMEQMESISKLRGTDADEKKFFAVENIKMFEDELLTANFDDLFFDGFGGNFGHLTERGAQLVAENAKNKILELQKKGLCGL